MTDSSSYDHFLRGVLFGATVCFIINTIFLINKDKQKLISRLEKCEKKHESSQDSN